MILKSINKNIVCLLFISIVSLYLNCSSNSLSNFSDDELLSMGWQDFRDNDHSSAKNNFSELINRNAFLAEAYAGLGWANAFLNSYSEALDNFNNALQQSPSEELENDIYAGLCIVNDANNSPQNCLAASENVATDWAFQYITGLNYNDIILLRAFSNYALGNFSASLNEVKVLDSDFNVDVSTILGRVTLADKIEMLGN